MIVDLGGERFGRLVVIERYGCNVQGRAKWLCRCDCGRETAVDSRNLKSGNTRSCGCLRRDISVAKATIHGHKRGGKASPAYESWTHMIQRCTNHKNKDYRYYGGRGITVCERWREFRNFLKDMGEPPPGHEIDRIDNDKSYEPRNCRWVTRAENNRNTRRNRLLSHNGRTQCMAQWDRTLGLFAGCTSQRIRRGWQVERALAEASTGDQGDVL